MNVNLLISGLIFWMAMTVIDLFQTVLIIAKELITKRCCAIAWVWIIVVRLIMMITRVWHQSMRMASRMENKVHDDVYRQPCNADNQHCNRFCHKLLVHDSVSCFVNHENGQEPNDKEITQSADDFQTMKSKRHLFSGFFARKVNEEKADSKSNQISDEMKGVWNDSNGARNVSTYKLSSDKNEGDRNDDVQFTEIRAVVLSGRRLVDKPFVSCHRF